MVVLGELLGLQTAMYCGDLSCRMALRTRCSPNYSSF